ncbi:MAG: tRNA pseudouridine(55) synthase TruB [Patescibacteria group bacterium]
MNAPELLLVDKPAGITSHDVVDAARRIFKIRKIGHAGTLDPFATGLLILGIGPGTKKLTELVGLDKTYLATARLGATSTTDDPEGEIVETRSSQLVARSSKTPTRDAVEEALKKYRGTFEQTSPLYSAKKIKGQKMYELARKGLGATVELPKKMVTISGLKVLEYSWPFLTLEVSCSSGTYIRALARDIGRDLGCGAYLTALRRTRIGEFKIEDAKKLDSF